MDILVAAAHRMELDPFRNKLTRAGYTLDEDGDFYYRDEEQGDVLRLLETGIGLEKSGHRLASELGTLQRPPDLIINFGTCGGIDPDVSLGDLIVVSETRREGGGSPVELSGPMTGRFREILTAQGYTHKTGAIYSTEKAITDEVSRDNIFRSTGAQGVDMECYTLAEVCQKHDVPIVSLKYVSDNADEFTLKDFIANLDDASDRLGDVVLEFIRHLA